MSKIYRPKAPKFAVLLAAYNGLDYLDKQINSIFFQENVDVHVFISIDRSSDGTEQFLVDLAKLEPRISILPLNRFFGNAAANFFCLIREVDLDGFDYLSLSDQDDIWHSEKLWRAHCMVIRNKVSCYSSNVTAFWPSGASKLVYKSQAQKKYDFLFEAAGPGCTYVINSEASLSLQRIVRENHIALDAIHHHDWFIYAFARVNGFDWFIDSWSSLQYRQHNNNQLGVNSDWRSFKYRVMKILSHHGFDQAFLISKILDTSTFDNHAKASSGSRTDYFWLALNFRQCRRKGVDQILFLLICIILILVPRILIDYFIRLESIYDKSVR